MADPEEHPEGDIPLEERRFLVAARIGFAGLFVFILMLVLGIAMVGPLIDRDYDVDATLIVPVVVTLGGMVLMLLGIEIETFWTHHKGDDG